PPATSSSASSLRGSISALWSFGFSAMVSSVGERFGARGGAPRLPYARSDLAVELVPRRRVGAAIARAAAAARSTGHVFPRAVAERLDFGALVLLVLGHRFSGERVWDASTPRGAAYTGGGLEQLSHEQHWPLDPTVCPPATSSSASSLSGSMSMRSSLGFS